MTSIAKVQSRGQVTLPSQERKAIGLQPGDTVVVRQTGDQTLELRALPKITLADLIERYPIEGPVDWDVVREEWEAEAAKDFIEGLDG